MNANDPSTNCFITTARDHPITLWDTQTGVVRATYSGINHLDELDPAVSLAFNLTGDRIYAGSNKMIRCFDLSRPGRDGHTSQATTKSRKSPLGQKGLISTIAFNPDHSGAYAAGSYANSIGVYVENSRECVFQIDEMEFGVSCLRWSPCGRFLWAGGRHHESILCWDIRQTGQCVGSVKRSLLTNQKMLFDIDPWGCYLATGSDRNEVLLYDTTTFELVHSQHCVDEVSDTFKNGNDISRSTGDPKHNITSNHSRPNNPINKVTDNPSCAVHGVMFHPCCALLLTSSGGRVFTTDDEEASTESEGDKGVITSDTTSSITADVTGLKRPREDETTYFLPEEVASQVTTVQNTIQLPVDIRHGPVRGGGPP
eukprot:gene25627-32103_t